MTHSLWPKLIALLFFISPLFASFTEANESPSPVNETCPPAATLKEQLDTKISQRLDTSNRLQIFLTGQELTNVQPSVLFTVDLEKEEAVQRRRNELTERLNGDQSKESEVVAALRTCVENTPALAEKLDELNTLEQLIDTLRLEFLSLEPSRRSALLAAQKAVVHHAEVVQQLEQERELAEQQKSVAQRSMEIAQEQAKTAASTGLRELGGHRALLEKNREELATIKVKWTAQFEERTKYYQAYAEQLSALNAAVNLTERKVEHVHNDYIQAANIWRDMVDGIFTHIADPHRDDTLPDPPTEPEALLIRLGDVDEVLAYREAHAVVQSQYDELALLRISRFNEERDNAYRLLLQAGKLRSELLKRSIDMGDTSPLELTREFFYDLAREIRIVPYRWIAIFYSNLIDISHKLGDGFKGIVDLVKQASVFLLVVAIPFIFYYLLQRLTEYLNTLRRDLLRRQFNRDAKNRQFYGKVALWIQRSNPYLPWVVMLIGLRLAKDLITLTDLAELAELIPYIEYYVWYRILLNILVAVIGVVAHAGKELSGDVMRLRVRARVQRTTKEIGIFYLLAMIILHATESVVGEALVFRIVSAAMLYMGALICLHAAHQWRNEIASSAEKRLPKILGERIKRYCLGWASWFVALPALILITIFYLLEQLGEVANEIDFVKRMGAELFRHRLENVVGKEQRPGSQGVEVLPESYLQLFDLQAPTDSELIIEPTTGVVEKIISIINEWGHELSGENSLALYGDKGSGKSSLLKVMDQHMTSYHILHITVPPKLITREAVLRFFSQQLGVDLTSGTGSLSTLNITDKKTLIFVDEAHNLFLSVLGGFEGYKAFVELLSADAEDVFWVANFNRRSWGYLNGVFGGHQFFNHEMEIPPFNEDDIQNLIMVRHEKSDFRISYDSIIRASQSNDEYAAVDRIESQFFRLLWGQSKGNPRAALVLWLSALQPKPGNVLKVGIPQFPLLKGLETSNDEAMFVYAAVIRHENISLRELVEVISLPEGIIRDALKFALQCDAIMKTANGRYQVTPAAQASLTQLLTGKNFIYG